MKSVRRLAAASAFAVAAVIAVATPALAHAADQSHDRNQSEQQSDDFGHFARGAGHVVFVQTDNPSGNAVVAYDRADDGTLTQTRTYPTGGDGGVLTGSVVDHLASQASLTYDDEHALLFALNAGSNSVSVFSVNGDRLTLRQVVPSYGQFPVSVAVHGNLVYVLNARAGGSVQGFGIFGEHLFPLGSNRALRPRRGRDSGVREHTGAGRCSPRTARSSSSRRRRTAAASTFSAVGFFGTLSSAVVNTEPGMVPFALTFDGSGNLVVTDAGTNAVATFDLHHDGTITLLHMVPTNQAATCWIVGANGRFYVSNAGNASLTEVRSGPRAH